MKGRMIRMAEIDEETTKEPSSIQLALERTNLSHEQTLMSWVRTATSLITFGFTIYKFFQLELENRPPLQDVIGPRQFAVLMISIGLFSLMAATIEYRVYRNGLRRRYAGHPPLSLVGSGRCIGVTPWASGSRCGSLQDVTVGNCRVVSMEERSKIV
jgi:putative membrane protein